MKYEPKLDGMRSYAALAVIGMHWHELLPFGWVGVQFFFVLSGYLITSILISGRERVGTTFRTFLANFFRRRSLRLFPLYYAFTVFLILDDLLKPRSNPVWRTLPYIFTYTLNVARMLPDYVTGQSYTHLWSLCVEWQFYLIWPILLWWVGRRHLRVLALCLIATAPVFRFLTDLSVAGVALKDGSEFYYRAYVVYNSPFSHLDAFAFGALLVDTGSRELLGRAWVRFAIACTLAATGLAVVIAGRPFGYAGFASLGFPPCMPHFGEKIWGYSLLNCASACVISWALQAGRAQQLIFGNRVAVYLGSISYGIYMWHFPIVLLCMSLFDGKGSVAGLWSISGLVIATACSIAVAAFSYPFIEKPFLNLKQRSRTENPLAGVAASAERIR